MLKTCLLTAVFFASSFGIPGECAGAPHFSVASHAAISHSGQKVVRASWYRLFGRRLASGKWYDRNAVFAAHREYPFGTKLCVTNLRNHRTIILPVEDRGPYVSGRSLDLSYEAAKRLGMIDAGTVLVSYRVAR